ncbi:hypothetical protein [Parvibium lacunae]|uniref:DUF3630 family protein n=1 Tax=Parvibium lacunae TaxID=1888893 RepID=A0A368L4S4_9BURK|nr:hypothetical protein [Parvibium lacunae]RCS58579.1 hypothetical protein DU000_07170 [Parvibium lacunae]
MNTKLPPIRTCKNKDGAVEYHIEVDSEWDGLDSFVQYLQKHWQAEVNESSDSIYSRRWVLRSNDVPISVYHDSQIGNYFLREDGIDDQSLLEKIKADLMQRLK